MAVSSMLIEQQPVAETIEIETQNCTEIINLNTNAANLLANNQQSATILTNSSNLTTIPSTTFHIIQDISQNTLLDNFVEQDKLIDGVSNKILTPTAYLANTSNTINNSGTTNKQTKSKNLSTNKDKNTQINKHQKSNTTNNGSKLPVTSSNQQHHLNNSNNTTTSYKNHNLSSKNKSSPLVTVTTLTNVSTSNQTEQNKDKEKKAKVSGAIAVPIDEPFIFNSNLGIDSNKLITSQSSLVQQPPTTVTVQIINANQSSNNTIEVASNLSTNNFTGRGNNNLDTIVEAIRHIEGSNMFGENNHISTNDVLRDLSKDDANRKQLNDNNKNLKNETNEDRKINNSDQNESLIKEEFIKCVSNSRPGVIVVSSSNH